jgi:HK97 gp10 family phage protein|nr:MAG TPA: putative tail component [Caudoviricetes sp.]
MIEGVLNLNKYFDKMSELDLKTAIGKGISFVQETAKGNCPTFDGELRNKILTEVTEEEDKVNGTCWPDVRHGVYVELGTGPRGQANHEGISPDVTVAYTQSPWWIHEGQGENEIDRETAEHYHFFHIDTDQGRFYQCTGQAAQPYLYPALKNNEDKIVNIIRKELKNQL